MPKICFDPTKLLTKSAYARKHKTNRMQVDRDIKAGKLKTATLGKVTFIKID